ncbi:MAG: hypothetical protein US57_C0011G0071 [Candidatus Moranbacteria bacterium GW2011_GWC2_37_73]|nr:MAG: hypothetical protein UR95_C0006G0108 [Parcubacteria group bacterium GW2011_GWC1_36_108]KKQ00500.1 MAG: hypothetical protein US09_C0011G0058 [Candidatus Moranbacteria bacterium GW2011_GWD1_36_198]KKQ39583.1 MAG: hypothetical protein US57_C0011G0071 [Candidatus Moranbacteria bacterium GW2011_GWC2_37_73]
MHCGCRGFQAEPEKKQAYTVNLELARFCRKNADEMPRMRNDPDYGVCTCGGQGNCLGCRESEIQTILNAWP